MLFIRDTPLENLSDPSPEVRDRAWDQLLVAPDVDLLDDLIIMDLVSRRVLSRFVRRAIETNDVPLLVAMHDRDYEMRCDEFPILDTNFEAVDFFLNVCMIEFLPFYRNFGDEVLPIIHTFNHARATGDWFWPRRLVLTYFLPIDSAELDLRSPPEWVPDSFLADIGVPRTD